MSTFPAVPSNKGACTFVLLECVCECMPVMYAWTRKVCEICMVFVFQYEPFMCTSAEITEQVPISTNISLTRARVCATV